MSLFSAFSGRTGNSFEGSRTPGATVTSSWTSRRDTFRRQHISFLPVVVIRNCKLSYLTNCRDQKLQTILFNQSLWSEISLPIVIKYQQPSWTNCIVVDTFLFNQLSWRNFSADTNTKQTANCRINSIADVFITFLFH